MVLATLLVMLVLAKSAKVTVVPVISMIGCPSKEAPFTKAVGTLATVTKRESVLLEVTLTVLVGIVTVGTVPAVKNPSPGCTGIGRQ